MHNTCVNQCLGPGYRTIFRNLYLPINNETIMGEIEHF